LPTVLVGYVVAQPGAAHQTSSMERGDLCYSVDKSCARNIEAALELERGAALMQDSGVVI
jgi:hypothetical protein